MTDNFFKNKTVLVTGAAGFIGSHLSEALLKQGAKVIGVDNYLTGSQDNIVAMLEAVGDLAENFLLIDYYTSNNISLSLENIFYENKICITIIRYRKRFGHKTI